MTATVEMVAGRAEAGARIDAALAALPEVGSRAAAQRLIAAGKVTVDGTPLRKRHRLVGGERIVARLGDPEDQEVTGPAPYAVRYEDEQLLVVDKPAGVVVHPGAGSHSGTLAQALAGRAAGGADAARAGIVHRLDRDTSGLMVVAKSEEMHRALGALIRGRALEREYRALAQGHPDSAAGTIEAPLGRDRRRRTAVSTKTDRPRQARTHFWTVERLSRATLLGVRLDTGRTHQIRAHLTAIGHPICGDRRYGGIAFGKRLGLERQFLHSARLAFAHPTTGERLAVESPLPEDLARALEAARRER